MSNYSSEWLTFSRNESFGIMDLRLIGYYKVRESNIQHPLKPYYEFRPLQLLYEEFNKVTNKLRREKQKSIDPYSWLDEDDERRSMSDRGICKSGDFIFRLKEKDELMEILYYYKDAFSLRDKIDMCPSV